MNRENKPNAPFFCDECAFNQSLNLAHQVTSWTLRRRVGSWALMKDEDGSYSSRVDDDDIYIMMSVCLSEKSSLLGFSWFLVGFHGF